MTHKEIYFYLVKKENEDSLRELFIEEGIFEDFKVTDMEIHTKAGFPYILLLVKPKEIFAAMFIGVFVDIKPMLPDYPDEWYYLPFIQYCPTYPKKYQAYIDRELSIIHEITHIKDILALIEKNPGYVDTVSKYTMFNEDLTLEDLEKSIDFEISKIFYLEPKALAGDYASGETVIYSDMMGEIKGYPCQTVEEYVQLKIIHYKNKIKDIYAEKFPGQYQGINELINEAINKYGKEVFGDPAYPNMHERERAHLMNRMVTFLMSRKPTGRYPAPQGSPKKRGSKK